MPRGVVLMPSRALSAAAQTTERVLAALFITGGDHNHPTVSRASREPVPIAVEAGLPALEGAGVVERRGDLLVVRPAAASDLGKVVVAYLNDEGVPASMKRNVRLAIRNGHDLPASCPDADLIEVLSTVALDGGAALWPEWVFNRNQECLKSPATCRNCRAWARGLLKYAVEHGYGFALPADWIRGQTEAVKERVMAGLAKLWIETEAPILQDLLTVCDVSDEAARRVVERWEVAGILETVRAGKPVRLLRCVQPGAERATLANVVEAFARGELGHEGMRSKVFAALRAYFGLARGRDEAMLSRARDIPGTEIRDFLGGLRETLLDRGVEEESARQYERSVRRVLQTAAARGIIPLDWSGGRRSQWDDVKWEWFPAGPGQVAGLTVGARNLGRTTVGWLAEALGELGVERDPQATLMVDVEAAMRWLMRRGRYRHSRLLGLSLRRAGRGGLGPYANETVRDPRPIRLTAPSGKSKGFKGLMRALRYHRLANEWREFALFVRLWSTLSRAEIDGRGWPVRPPSRKLKSVGRRLDALRVLLGVLHHEFGVDLSALSLDEALGFRRVRQVLARLEAIWKERGDLTSPHGTSLQLLVVNIGLLSETLYRRRIWEREEQALALAEHGPGRAGVDADAEEDRDKTATENSLWRAYRHSRVVADGLKSEAVESGQGTAGSKNTEKDLARIIEATSGDWHLRVQEALLATLWRGVQRGEDGPDHHDLVALAFTNGMLLSTLCRGDELRNLRMDVHLDEKWWSATDQELYIQLRSCDRKNGAHRVCVRPALVPAWLRLAYLQRTRPRFMAGLVVTEKGEAFQRSEHHQHLLVNRQGRAYGASEELRDGTGRPGEDEMDKRLSGLREFWQNHLGRFAWEVCGLECPDFDWGFGLHSVRNTMGHSIFHALGLEAAMNILGDSGPSIQRHYSQLDTLMPPLDRVRAVYGGRR